MDRKLYTDSFERLLRERADEFRMYPTRRVWHSVYNNIYPGRRGPSAIIGMLLIAIFPLVGYLNNNDNLSSYIKERSSTVNTSINYASLIHSEKINPGLRALNDKAISLNTVYISDKPAIKPDNKLDRQLLVTNASVQNNQRPAINKLVVMPVTSLPVKSIMVSPEKKYLDSDNSNPVASNDGIKTVERNTPSEKNTLLEKYSIQNSPLPGKWADKLALQVYASPSIVYGILSSSKNNSPTLGGMQDVNNTQNPSIGLEAGTAMQYSLSTAIKVKAGLQFNYASYDVEAMQNNPAGTAVLNEPAATSTNAYTMARAIDYANSNGIAPITLHNETYQFSLPVGLELKLFKNNNLQWNAGATIQPTYIAGGNAYLLSSYNHNYIDESSIINRWNLNAGLETFITYKVNGVTWQFGPQFRYQFSSTYGKGYAVDEKLAVFGVKVGVSKTLR